MNLVDELYAITALHVTTRPGHMTHRGTLDPLRRDPGARWLGSWCCLDPRRKRGNLQQASAQRIHLSSDLAGMSPHISCDGDELSLRLVSSALDRPCVEVRA
jgi:hypothetical protein